MVPHLPPEPSTAPPHPDASALERRLEFLRLAGRLKHVERRTLLAEGGRRENSAEHSWHVALYALTLAEHAPPGTDVSRAIAMLLVHDLVEVLAGDTYAYGDAAWLAGQREREVAAADRIFGMLPPPQDAELRALWDEFEAGESPTARYAVALDRLQAILQNDASGGASWREHGVSRSAVRRRGAPIETAIPDAWPTIRALLERNAALGNLRTDDGESSGA